MVFCRVVTPCIGVVSYYNQQDHDLNLRRREDLKFRITYVSFGRHL